jgi:hypothetical protein
MGEGDGVGDGDAVELEAGDWAGVLVGWVVGVAVGVGVGGGVCVGVEVGVAVGPEVPVETGASPSVYGISPYVLGTSGLEVFRFGHD